MCGCEGIVDKEGAPLFQFSGDRLSMSDARFHEAWGCLPVHYADIIHSYCLDVNPDWDFRISKNAVLESSAG
jgi:hypothetical protein